MKRIVFAFSILSSCTSYADDNINLIHTKYTQTKECSFFRLLKPIADFNQSKQFSIPDEDYVEVSFLSGKNKKCYSMKYYPDMSPFLQFKISNKNIIIEEVPSIATGYTFYKIYKISTDRKKLIYKDTVPLN